MLDTKLQKTGTILIHNGQIHIDGFSADGCMCREVGIHALMWAIGEMQREIVQLIAVPGGSGNTVVDLPHDVRKALGLPEWFEEEDE